MVDSRWICLDILLKLLVPMRSVAEWSHVVYSIGHQYVIFHRTPICYIPSDTNMLYSIGHQYVKIHIL